LKIKGKTYTTKKPIFLVDVEYELEHSRKLQAVKYFRDKAGCGLKAAKDAVDMYCQTKNWAHLDDTRVVYKAPFINSSLVNMDIDLLKRIPEKDVYVVDSMRSEAKGLSKGLAMESIIWKYENQYEWISDIFTLEEIMHLIEDCVV